MGHRQSDLLQYLTSIAQIEEDTGIRFVPELAAPARMTLENETAARLW
jgi:hypothetical protein